MAASSALSAEWKGRRHPNGKPVKLNHNELGEANAMGHLRLYTLRTADSLDDVLYSQGSSIAAGFDGYWCGANWDLRVGDWILASCSIEQKPFEAASLVVLETSDDRKVDGANFMPSKSVRVGFPPARILKEKK